MVKGSDSLLLKFKLMKWPYIMAFVIMIASLSIPFIYSANEKYTKDVNINVIPINYNLKSDFEKKSILNSQISFNF